MTNLPLFIGIRNVVYCKVKPPWECTAAEWSCCRCCDPPQAKNLICQILCYDIGNCSAGLCYNDTLLVRMRTRMRGSIAAQSCAARQKCASFTVYYNERLCEAHFRFLWEMLFPGSKTFFCFDSGHYFSFANGSVKINSVPTPSVLIQVMFSS